jgi:predicted outer membrane repeat protein
MSLVGFGTQAGVLLSAVALGCSGATAAQAQAAVPVPCTVAALGTAISGAADGATLSLAPLCVYTLTAALPMIDASITIVGNRATIERSGAGATPGFSILTIGDTGALSIGQVTLSNGDGEGGAILDGGGPLTVTGSTLSDNASGAAGPGGAIYSDGTGNMSVNGSTFTDNSTDELGGAIYTGGGLVTVAGSAFSGNTAGSEGGAIVNNGGTLIVTQTTFTDNAAHGSAFIPAAAHVKTADGIARTGDGGAIFSDGVLAVGASTFTDNLASVNEGILVASGVRPDVITRTGDGGAVFSYGSLTIINSTYTGNSATRSILDVSRTRTSRGPDLTSNAGDGGGIFSEGDLTITGSRISMSTASGQGGGVYNFGKGILNHSHVLLNSAENGGGGIFNEGGTVTLNATTVTLNQPDNCEPLGTIAGCFF